MKYLLFAVFTSISLLACSKKELVHTEFQQESNTAHAPTSGFRSNVTLATFEAAKAAILSIGGELLEAKENEPLRSDWNYSTAFIYQPSEGDKNCLYLFDNYEHYVQARQNCDKNYFLDPETDKMCCTGAGETCAITILPDGVEISVCHPM